MASSSKDSVSHEKRSSSQGPGQKLTWNPVLKSDRPKFGYAAPGNSSASKKEATPRAPEKRPAVPRFRHPTHGETEEDPPERRPAVPRFRHPPERQEAAKENHPLMRGADRPVRKTEPRERSNGNGLEDCAWCGQKVQDKDHIHSCELRPAKCRYCAQLLVVATREQHERSCFERMFTEAPPSDPPHRSRSSSLNLSNAPAPSTSLWAPSEQLRTRAQRHQQAVHAATKEAMVAEEDDQNMVLTVDALETDFKSLSKELNSLALPSAAMALLGQLQPGSPQSGPLDQLIDLQRRHSVLGSILRLAEEHRSTKPPPFAPQAVKPHTPTGWPGPPVQSLSSSAKTPRRVAQPRPTNLPPLETPRPGLSRSSSRSSLRSVSVSSVGSRRTRSGPVSGVRQRQRSSSARSVRSSRRGASRAASVASRAASVASRAASVASAAVELRASPGPAAVGFREMSVEEMKAEIEVERQQYIAERLSTA